MELKYTSDGKKVAVIGKLNAQETIVQEIFVINEQEIPSGENFVAKSLHDAPAISWKEKEVARIEANLEKIKELHKRAEEDYNKLNAALKNMKTGIELISEERLRQMEAEGWTISHDSKHIANELSYAAITYATPPEMRQRVVYETPLALPLGHIIGWPWDMEYFKPSPSDRVRELVKAGALIAAEIDRLNASGSDTGKV